MDNSIAGVPVDLRICPEWDTEENKQYILYHMNKALPFPMDSFIKDIYLSIGLNRSYIAIHSKVKHAALKHSSVADSIEWIVNNFENWVPIHLYGWYMDLKKCS